MPAPYNAADSGGSNLGPTNQALIDRVRGAVEKLWAENPGVPVPADLVTTSGSGLDPDISLEAADNPSAADCQGAQPIGGSHSSARRRTTAGRVAGLIGEPRVNVLALNLALDAIVEK